VPQDTERILRLACDSGETEGEPKEHATTHESSGSMWTEPMS
jgi:hypothetical protein